MASMGCKQRMMSSPSHETASLRPPRFLTLRTVIALMLREMGSTYGRSPGGYFWAIAQPIGMIMVLALAFGLLFRSPSLGTSFILFYSTGFLPFDLYNQLQSKISSSLIYSRAMLAYPRVTWLDTILARFVLNTITLLTVFCIVITGILLVVDTHTIISITPILLGLSMAAALGLGVGLMNCLLGGLFPVWDILWRIIMRPMFMASGVLFIFEDMPRFVQTILWWNPVFHVTGLMRMGFYQTYSADYISLRYGFGVAFVLMAAGLLFLRANYQRVLEK
ncbi:capsular polysaccharide transport system permease protein [Planktotalea frisia]|uniref:Transport permease protein n=3 Tax=Planktotalea frisia TaxID=696762 RepID=A0A1L9NSD6_9RHOB|nr:polysialic acid transport protein KpsM [Planktotalea frisia]PZX23110.1 capsular polysaccharide transport system permease protein [Planktotalea frisia]